MNVIIKEYGKIIVYIIVGTLALGILIAGVRNWYKITFPNIDIENGIALQNHVTEPVIVAEKIEIEKEEINREIDFRQYIKAYENSDLETVIEADIIGSEEVDITISGLYQIICTATNSEGNSFSKRISVLVY